MGFKEISCLGKSYSYSHFNLSGSHGQFSLTANGQWYSLSFPDPSLYKGSVRAECVSPSLEQRETLPLVKETGPKASFAVFCCCHIPASTSDGHWKFEPGLKVPLQMSKMLIRK